MSQGYYRVGQYYFDTVHNALYRCTGAGTNATATWVQVSGVSVQQFKIAPTGTKDGGDFYNCYTWNGTTLGSTVVKVAKQYKMRALNGPTSETIRGTAYTYTYAYNSTNDEYVRTTNGGTSTDYPTPPALPGDIIVAIPFTTAAPSTLVGVAWIEITERKWASA